MVPVFRLPSGTARSKINCDVQATGGTGVDDGPVVSTWYTLGHSPWDSHREEGRDRLPHTEHLHRYHQLNDIKN
jgi:hypothetical protein